MKNGFTLVIASLLFAICYGMLKIKSAKNELADSLVRVLGVAIATSISFICYTMAGNDIAAYIFSSFYFASIDWLLICILNFTEKYTEIFAINKTWKKVLLSVAMADGISLIMNLLTRHAYGLGRRAFCGDLFYCTDYLGIAFVFHLFFSYVIVLVIMILFTKKFFAVPDFYKKKYGVVLAVFAFIILLNGVYVFTKIPLDISLPIYAMAALFIAYFSLYYMPVGLVEKTLLLVIADINSGLVCFDFNGKCIYANELARDIFDAKEDPGILEKYFHVWVDRRRLVGEKGEKWQEGHIYNDKEIYIEAEFNKILDDKQNLLGYYFYMTDKTYEVERYQKERYRANHDSLTKIYNRERFYERVSEIIHDKPDEPMVMVCSNIKDFKMVNGFFGREMGDNILKRQAVMMREMANPGTVYGRLSGDKFAMCLPKKRFNTEVFVKCINELEKIYNNIVFRMQVYIGIYEITDIDEDVSVMCDKANMAIESIYGQYNNNVAYYNESIMKAAKLENDVIGDFESAMENNEFHMYLQPQVDDNGNILGGEALVRWIHPVKGMIFPKDFISVFEKCGFIYHIDKFIWECAVKQLARWKGTENDSLYISINISAKDFFYIDVYEVLKNLVEKYEVSPEKLKLEITENVLVAEFVSKNDVLAQLREFGFKIEMDDFGKGYSSINVLKDLEINAVKIDMGIWDRDTRHKDKNMAVLDAVIILIKKLGMEIIAEDVETEEQLEILKKLGCKKFQGYCYFKPVSVGEFEQIIRQRQISDND